MRFKEEIEKYIPINEQEEKDKQAILMCINKFKKIYFEQMGECFHINKQDKKFTGPEFLITVRQP